MFFLTLDDSFVFLAVKLDVVNKARKLGLWEEPSLGFKERQRCVLKILEVPRAEAVEQAWTRLSLVLDLVSETSNPFEQPEATPVWQDLVTDVDECDFDRDSNWAFIHFLENEHDPPTDLAAELVQFAVENPAWFLLAGARYGISPRLTQELQPAFRDGDRHR